MPFNVVKTARKLHFQNSMFASEGPPLRPETRFQQCGIGFKPDTIELNVSVTCRRFNCISVVEIVKDGIGNNASAVGKDNVGAQNHLCIDLFGYFWPISSLREMRFGRYTVHGLTNAITFRQSRLQAAHRCAERAPCRDGCFADATQPTDCNQPRRLCFEQVFCQLEIVSSSAHNLSLSVVAVSAWVAGDMGSDGSTDNREEGQ